MTLKPPTVTRTWTPERDAYLLREWPAGQLPRRQIWRNLNAMPGLRVCSSYMTMRARAHGISYGSARPPESEREIAVSPAVPSAPASCIYANPQPRVVDRKTGRVL
jgi:hypothetical protein